MTEPSGSARRRERMAGALVFVLAFAVYLVSPVRRFIDPRYTVLTAESLITRGSFDLTRYFAGGAPPGEDVLPEGAGHRQGAPTWQIARSGERLYLWYPPGTSILVAPLVGALSLAGLSSVGPDDRFDPDGEDRLQGWVAALVAAATVVLVLRSARRELPLRSSVALALVVAFGSSLWSIASRALWSQSASALVLAAAWLELLRWEDGARRRPFLLGALLAAGFWVRPTNAYFAAACALYVAWRHRPALARVIATGALGLAAFVALSWRMWGDWLPEYYRLETEGGLDGFTARVAGLLFSPTRGLVAFTPALLLVPAVFLRHGVPRERRELFWLALVVVGAQVALYGTYWMWWGGASYGPRYFTDLVPLLAWMAALALRARSASVSSRASVARVLAGTAAAALLAWGMVAHGAGALLPRVAHVVRQSGRLKEDKDELWNWSKAPPVLVVRELAPRE